MKTEMLVPEFKTIWQMWAGVAVSIVLFFIALGYIAHWFFSKKRRPFSIVILSLLLLASIWGLRYAVGYYCFPLKVNEIPPLGSWEQIANSFMHALQTFSMDEDYTNYLRFGKSMIVFLTRGWEKCAFFAFLKSKNCIEPGFSFYICVLNWAAPIVGGAFIFEILAGIFPSILYRFSLHRFKPRCYFTALNEQSLALAQSIREAEANGRRKRSVMVFTDAYASGADEEQSELLAGAKAIGAICLKDDFLHIRQKKYCRINPVEVFLSSDDESENLETLASFCRREEKRIFKKMRIYVFATDHRFSNLEDEITLLQGTLLSQWKSRGWKQEEMPYIIPVSGVKSISRDLFYRVPLYEVLDKPAPGETKPLNLTIFGSGVIGTELFLNAIWFSQIPGVELYINVVAEDISEEEFRSRLDAINPELLKSAELGNDILRWRGGSDPEGENPPYFRLRFLQKNVLTGDFSELMTSHPANDGFALRDTDYFIVALGSDERNFTAADCLRQYLGAYHNAEAPDKRTVISYVIYNSALCETLNGTKLYNHVIRKKDDPVKYDIYMHAFGSMKEIYSVDTIFYEGIDVALASRRSEKSAAQEAHEEKLKDAYSNMAVGYYNYRATVARRLQIYYKAYAAGMLEPWLFRTDAEKDVRLKEEEGLLALKAFRDKNGKTSEEMRLLHRLAWGEHRRWCAFMRINGFVRPRDMDSYYYLRSEGVHNPGDHKMLSLKLHPCLVESNDSGVGIPMDGKGIVSQSVPKEPGKDGDAAQTETVVVCDLSNEKSRDRLDEVSLQRTALRREHIKYTEYAEPGRTRYAFKTTDYLQSEDFGEENIQERTGKKHGRKGE